MENLQLCQVATVTSFMSWESQAISRSDLIAQSARESTLVVARRLRGDTSFKKFQFLDSRIQEWFPTKMEPLSPRLQRSVRRPEHFVPRSLQLNHPQALVSKVQRCLAGGCTPSPSLASVQRINVRWKDSDRHLSRITTLPQFPWRLKSDKVWWLLIFWRNAEREIQKSLEEWREWKQEPVTCLPRSCLRLPKRGAQKEVLGRPATDTNVVYKHWEIQIKIKMHLKN